MKLVLHPVFGILVLALAIVAWRIDSSLDRPETSAKDTATPDCPTIDPDDFDHDTGSSSESAIGAMHVVLQQMRDLGPADRGVADELLSTLIARLSPQNVAAMVRSLSPEGRDTPFGAAALRYWLHIDGATAATWIASRPDATEVDAWAVAHALVPQPEILVAVGASLGADPWVEAFLDCASRELVRTNPDAAVAFAESLQSGDRQTRLFETIACDWMDRDPRVAGKWISRVRDRVLRERLVSIGAQSFASTDPLRALEWLLIENASGVFPRDAVQTILGRWIESSLLPESEVNEATPAFAVSHLL